MSKQPQKRNCLSAWMLTAFFIFASPVDAQVEVGLSPIKSLVGAVEPRNWGNRVLVGVDSSVSVVSGMMLEVTTNWAVVIVARCNGSEIEPETSVENPGQFLFLQTGSYVVDIVAFETGQKPFKRTVEFQVTAGEGPRPPPDDNKPKPKPDVRNDYGLGVIAADAPQQGREKVADIYKQAAGFLRGVDGKLKHVASDNGSSTDESNVLVWVRRRMDELPNAEEWKPWRRAIADALKASQVARGQYSADDWFAAFMEISDGVK